MHASPELSQEFLSPSDAAARLDISVKALRLYERHGLVDPVRSAAGWRTYGPEQMARAGEVAGLRRLGLSLAQIAAVRQGDAADLGPALDRHRETLEARMRDLGAALGRLRDLRADLARGGTPDLPALADLAGQGGAAVAFDLPWPSDGERFALHDIGPLNFITGPLGSGKTRFAKRLAEALPDARFVGLDRLDDVDAARARLAADPALAARVAAALDWLAGDGAAESDALLVLLAHLLADGSGVMVVDLVEQGLDEATQEALIAFLRGRGAGARPLFLMTRSTAILDPAGGRTDEPVVFCPANHAPPMRVMPFPGAPGWEALASCLASPDVRARSEGVVAVRIGAA